MSTLLRLFESHLLADQFESARAYSYVLQAAGLVVDDVRGCSSSSVRARHHDYEERQERNKSSEALPGLVTENIPDAVSVTFQRGLLALPPNVRRIAPSVYALVDEFLGDCTAESFVKYAKGVAQLAFELRQPHNNDLGEFLRAWTLFVDRCVPCQLGSLFNFIDALLVSMQLINVIFDWGIEDFACAYFDWVAVLLRAHMLRSEYEGSRTSLDLLLTPGILRLFAFHPQHLEYLLTSPLCLAALLRDDVGREAFRVLLECAASISGEADEEKIECWLGAFRRAFMVCDTLSAQCANREAVIEGLPLSAWYLPLSTGGYYRFTPGLLVVQLTLKHLAPIASLHTRDLTHGLSATKQMLMRQKFAGLVVRALVAHLPHRVLAPIDKLRLEIICDAELDTQSGSSQPTSPSSDKPSSDTLRKRKSENNHVDKMRQGQVSALGALEENLAQPFVTFITQIIFLAPERRDARDKVLSFVCIMVRELRGSQCDVVHRLLVTLCRLTSHDKTSVRMASIEALCLIVMSEAATCVSALHLVCSAILARASDLQPTVRSRALDILSQVLITVKSAQWLQRWLEPDSALATLLDIRLTDEKLICRKSCIGLLETLAHLFAPPQSILNLIDSEVLIMLADDAALTVRQRSVGLMAILLGMSKTGLVAARCLLRLALDNEESIHTRARALLADQIFAQLPLELRRLLRGSSFVCDAQSMTALTAALLENQNDAESAYRILSLYAREKDSTLPICIIKAICDSHLVGDTCLLLPIGVLRILTLCQDVCAASMGRIAPSSGLLGHELTKAMIKHRVLSTARPEQLEYVTMCLKLLISTQLPETIRVLLRDHIRAELSELSLRPSLTRPALELYFAVLPDAKVIRTELTRLILFVRDSLSDLSSAKGRRISAQQAATALQTAGFVYTVSTQLPPNNKVALHLAEVAPALATFMLGIARDAFRSDSVHPAATQENSDSPRWSSSVPLSLRGIALTSAAQVLLANTHAAKRLMPQLILSGLGFCDEASHNISPLMVNLAFAVFDFSLRMTSLVDPYFALISTCLAASPRAQPNSDEFIRGQVLTLLAQQAAQDYLKPKGLLLYHLLYTLGDPAPHVRHLSQLIYHGLLVPKIRDILHAYFVEMICYLNGFLEHPTIKLALDLHPLALDVPGSLARSVESFCLRDDPARRNAIYQQLLASANDVTKHILIKKLLSQFLQPFLPVPVGSDSRKSVPLPLSKECPIGMALADVLSLLASLDMRLSFSSAATSMFVQDAGTDWEEELREAKETRARRCRDLLKEFVAGSIVPVLTALRRALQAKNSALQREVYDTLAILLYEWRCELEDMLPDDPRLIGLLRRSYAEPSTTPEREATFDEVFLKQDLRCRYASKSLETRMLTRDSRRQSINIISSVTRSTMPFSVMMHSVEKI